MVSETEAIAELSCTREHPSLIHYAARHGQVSDSAHTPQDRFSGHVTNLGARVFQERVLLWLLQFMQEQAISLDEVDQNGNSAVHVAAQYGHLSCVQVLCSFDLHFSLLFCLGCSKKERQEAALPPISCCCFCSAERRTGPFGHRQKEKHWFSFTNHAHKCTKSACECFHEQNKSV